MKVRKPAPDMDAAPELPPRVITIYVEAGQDPVIDAEGFADYELEAVLGRAYYLCCEEEPATEEEEDDDESR